MQNLQDDIQSFVSKIGIHNSLAVRAAKTLQGDVDFWEKLVNACEKFKTAALIGVLPNSDAEVQMSKLAMSMEDLKGQVPFDVHIDSTNMVVSTHVPVLNVFSNEKAIVLSASADFDQEKFEEYAIQIYLDPSCHLTGERFLRRFKNGDFLSFARNNPPVLYLEYIADVYFHTYGWKSKSTEFKMIEMSNPVVTGFKKISCTPHY